MAERADLASAESTSPARALLIASLDDGVRSWVDTRRRLCSSSRRSSPLDITAMKSSAHQEACLAHSLHSYQALIAGLGDSRADDPVHDSELAGEIEALPSCEDRRIFDRWPLTKSTKEDEALASTLAAALTLELDGQHAAAEARAREVAAVDPREHPRRHAEALYRVGHILGSQHRLSAAYDALNAAYLAALRSGHDTLACQSAIYRAKLAANVGLDIESSNRALADAKAWRERSGLRSPVLEADLIEAEGLLAEAKGEFRRAADLHKEALDLRRGALGSSHPDVSKSLHNLANALSATGGDAARAQALVLLNEAIQLRERLLGADNPATADALLDLAYLESASDPRAARADLGRAQKIFEGAAGDHSVSLSNIQITLAQLARGEDDLERAATHLAEARRLQGETRDLPLTHYDRALLELEEGQLALQRMDFARSRQSLTQAIQLFRHRNLDSQEALDAQVLWIEAVRGLGDHGAIANLIVGEGPTIVGHLRGFSAEDRGKIAWYVADSLKQTGALTEAASFFRTALRAYQELEDHPSIAELRWELAQSLVSDESGLERESLAQEALDYYRDQKNRQMVATISRWLTKHKHQGQKSLHPTKSTQ